MNILRNRRGTLIGRGRRVGLIAAVAASALSVPALPVQAAEPSTQTTVVSGPFTVVATVQHVSDTAWRFTYAVTNNSVVSDYAGIPPEWYAWEDGVDHSGLGGLDLRTTPATLFTDVANPDPSFSGGVSDGAVDHYGYWDMQTWYEDGWRYREFWGHEPMAIYPSGQTVTFSFVASPTYPGTGQVRLAAYRYAEALRHPDDPTQWYTYSYATLPVPVTSPSVLVDSAVYLGTLKGLGPNAAASASKLAAFEHMLADADADLAAGDTVGACTVLGSAYLHADGEPQPPDFVIGVGVAQVADAIQAEMAAIGCS